MTVPRSIRHRATLLAGSLVVAVIVVYATATYHEIRGSALASAGARLEAASADVAGILAGTAELLRQQSAVVAANPVIAEYVANRSEVARPATVAALATEGSLNLLLGTELLDTAGVRLLATTDSLPTVGVAMSRELRELVRDADTGVGPLTVWGRRLIYPVVARVSTGGAPIGYVVRWRELIGTSEDRSWLEGLIGGGARVHLANTAGDVWTDMIGGFEAVPEPLRAMDGPTKYQPVGGEMALAAAAGIGGTPWSVIIDFPMALVLSDAQRVLSWLILIGLALLVTAGITAWVISGRMTGSIAELAAAASAISAGDYSRRAAVAGKDELATLAAAFNRMAESVAAAHRELEVRVDQLATLSVESRATRERLERVMASSRSILYTVKVQEGKPRLTWMSENIETLLGYPVEQAPQPGWWVSKVHPEDRDQVRESWYSTLANGETTQEYRFRHADGSHHWLRDEQRLLETEDGAAAEIIGTVSDVTARRHLEVAKEAAEAANLAKSAFLSRMSHELRTPMNAILGFAQLLELEVSGDQNRESAQQILRGGRHLLQLIDEVLDLARVEAGDMALSVEPVPLDEVVQESLELVEGMAAERSISVTVEVSPLYVIADQQRLKQVLLNLLSNAIKYNRPGGTVRIGCEASSGTRARLSVSDTGIGIAEDAKPRLFTPFDRLGVDEAEIPGTGLGLSLSKGLVEAMGGRIDVESTLGEGSSFCVELAVSAAPGPRIDPAAPASLPEQRFGGARRKILYIEDNVSNLHLVQRILGRRADLQIIPAMQGRIGLELARQHRPDLILLDVNLPDIMGDEVLATLQRDPELRSIPVVVISADATHSQVARLRGVGARDYITKPFEVERLMSAVTEALEIGADP